MKQRTGFAGVGLMGHGMALNILKHGHDLTVMGHRNREPVDDLCRRGAHEAADHKELAERSDIIILCLSNSTVVEMVIAELKPHLRTGQIIIDTSTSDPKSSRALAVELAGFGVRFADCPVTGGPEQAAAGELGAMVGADNDTFAAIGPVIDCFCARIARFGGPGDGHAAKLINNYLACGMNLLIADTYNVAARAGVDWHKLFDVMQCGSNNSPALRKIVEPALSGHYDGYRFSLANSHKDTSYFTALADELSACSPLAREIEKTYGRIVENGLGARNVSRLIDPALQDNTTDKENGP